MARKKLGEILLERGLIDRDQLHAALAYQKQWGHRLGVALVAKGFLTEGMLVKMLGEVMSLPIMDLSTATFEPEAIRLVSSQTCENNDLIPICLEATKKGRELTVAMADPMNVAVIDEIEFTTGCTIRPVLATISAIHSAVRKYYQGTDTVIPPLDVLGHPGSDSGKMQVVRSGGIVEEVDTSTYAESGAIPSPQGEEPNRGVDQAREQVEQIKAHRKKQITREIQRGPRERITAEEELEDDLQEIQPAELQALQKLGKYFWALMRVLAKKGLISKEEFLRELSE